MKIYHDFISEREESLMMALCEQDGAVMAGLLDKEVFYQARAPGRGHFMKMHPRLVDQQTAIMHLTGILPNNLMIHRFNPGVNLPPHTDLKHKMFSLWCDINLGADSEMTIGPATFPFPRRSMVVLKQPAISSMLHSVKPLDRVRYAAVWIQVEK